jgi:hypothetical protein
MRHPPLAIALVALLALTAGLASGAAGTTRAFAGTPAVTVPTQAIADFWLATPGGDVWNFGQAASYGSMGGTPLAKPIVGIASTPDSAGYWLVASDGGIFTFGDARFFGSTGNIRLNQPIVAMASTPDGAGYWLIASDGGIFTFGDARFFGSTGNIRLNQPIVAMGPTPDGAGYWLLASDGGIFTFGDARFYGSTGLNPSPDPAQKIVPDAAGGYWIVNQNGTARAFGNTAAAPPIQSLMFRGVTAGDRAVLFAFSQLGKPYIWGGTGPAGYDCSGLAYRSWQVGGGIALPRVANAQYNGAGTPVAWNGMGAGDLVFWGSNAADWTTVYHTAMYVGGGQIVESTGDHVQLSSLGQWGGGDLMPHGMHP